MSGGHLLSVAPLPPGGVSSEATVFQAWLLGACAARVEAKMKDNPNKHDTAEWRAWGRGFRAWERDAKHRK